MKYSKCKFKVEEAFVVKTSIIGYFIPSEYHTLFENGELHVLPCYSWDGASGAIDTESIIKPSCAHDILCELINEGRLPKSCQVLADQLLRDLYELWWQKELAMHPVRKVLLPFIKLRKAYIYRAVRIYQENKWSAPQKLIFEVY